MVMWDFFPLWLPRSVASTAAPKLFLLPRWRSNCQEEHEPVRVNLKVFSLRCLFLRLQPWQHMLRVREHLTLHWMDQNQRWTSQSFANWPHSTPVHPKKTRFLFCAVKQHGTGPWCVSSYLWKSRRGHLRLEVGVVDQVYSSKGKGLAERV